MTTQANVPANQTDVTNADEGMSDDELFELQNNKVRGIDNDNDDDPELTPEPNEDEPDGKQTGSEADEPAPLDGLLDGADPALKEYVNNLESDRDKLAQNAASNAGRASAAQRKADEAAAKNQELEQQLADMKASKTGSADMNDQEGDDALGMFIDEDEPGDSSKADVKAQVEAELNERLQPFKQMLDRQQQADAEAAEAARAQQLTEKVEDWQDIVRDPEYAKWFYAQPTGVQAMADSEDMNDHVYLADQFKAQVANKRALAKQSHQEKREAQQKGMGGFGQQRGNPSRTEFDPDDEDAAFEIHNRKIRASRGMLN